jgi:hypothetical protein
MPQLDAVLASPRAFNAEGHHPHPPHNMVLFGDESVFASHIVYKQPHNFQVILELELPEDVKQAYLAAKQSHPKDRFILLLNPMDIGEIEAADSIGGVIFRRGANGTRTDIWSQVTLSKADFKIIYFDELPLSLGVLEAA